MTATPFLSFPFFQNDGTSQGSRDFIKFLAKGSEVKSLAYFTTRGKVLSGQGNFFFSSFFLFPLQPFPSYIDLSKLF